MKKSVLVLFSFCIYSIAFAQKTEFRVSLNSGLFSFGGVAASNQGSIIQYYDGAASNIIGQGINTIYGKDVNPFIGLSFNVNRVTKKNVIYGLDLGIESLKSTLDVNSITQLKVNSTNLYSPVNARGNSELSLNSINLSPYIGHRFSFKNYSIDATAGVDLAYVLYSQYILNATDDNGTIVSSSNSSLKTKTFDIRPRIQLGLNYNKFGVYLGYSLGVKNYVSSPLANYSDGAFSRQIRFGISYRIK